MLDDPSNQENQRRRLVGVNNTDNNNSFFPFNFHVNFQVYLIGIYIHTYNLYTSKYQLLNKKSLDGTFTYIEYNWHS